MPKIQNSPLVNYILSIPSPHEQYLHIECTFDVGSDQIEVFLPSWRPGRYEISNFAKNIRGFKIFNEANELVPFQKSSKDSWIIDCQNTHKIKIKYQYYSNELNAGSTYVSDKLLYVNPVNCLIYIEELFNKPIHLQLDIPKNWQIATSLETLDATLTAPSFEVLYDSPFICSNKLVNESYTIGQTKFFVWFNDIQDIPWDRLLNDFERFSKKQIKDFGEFPSKEFHFLIHTPAYKAYHGVEHTNSTVIALGPCYDVFGRLYSELLGVSSHELYHAWNIKTIRPKAMHPYRFREENYSRLGYIYEGVTTYMGDLYLLKSGVFTLSEYLKELEQQFQRHFDNPARFYTSVGDSSFDTWLDGYISGAPGRKLSIYVEGCLLAFVTDFMIRKATKNKYGIEEVIKRMYTDPSITASGFDESDYQRIIEKTSGISFQSFFDNYLNGTHSYEPILQEALEYFGLEMKLTDAALLTESALGIKLAPGKGKCRIQSMALGSPAEMCGLRIGDDIIGVNQMKVDGDIENWLRYFNIADINLTLIREQKIFNQKMPVVHRSFFPKYTLRVLEKQNLIQSSAIRSWACDGSL